jgi:hypothetical protein
VPNISETDWNNKFEAAKTFMASRIEIPRLLIEVSSQHPLKDGLFPGEEFELRLLMGIDLHNKALAEGLEVEIFVPGSRHRIGEVADLVSLTKSGNEFLRSYGIPEEILHGQDLIDKYKGDLGVYSTADEAFVAASYFKDNPFGRLYSVVSPFQLTRKSLHYIWAEVLPQFYTAPTANSFHNPLGEIYYVLPYVRDIDPDWQGEDSERGNRSRAERVPRTNL